MNVLLVMIPLSIVLLIGAVAAFFWAVDHDQFEDMHTPALLPLSDDPAPPRWEAETADRGAPGRAGRPQERFRR